LLEASKDGGEDERRALAEWLLQSKRHARTHLFMAALDEELKHIDPQRRIPIPDVRRLGAAEKVKQLSSRMRPSARRALPWKWAAAATVLIAVTITLFIGLTQRYGGWQELRTEVGEQRSVQLKDGSIVQLNTNSRVQTRFSEQSREVRLLDGEAFFKVAKDAARPFKVHTTDATVVAVGTQFNVYMQEGRTKVSVLEGRVRVSARDDAPAPPGSSVIDPQPLAKSGDTLLLAAGDEAEINSGKAPERQETPNVAANVAWMQRRLAFKQEPLANVVMQFNRYRETPQFRVEDPELATRRYSGVFDVDDPQSLEAVLAAQRDVIVAAEGDIIAIRKRRESNVASPPR
jgi:transmembrane sensor